MTARLQGITEHLDRESFERVHKHYRLNGRSERDALRGALAFVFYSHDAFTIDEAWEAAEEITEQLFPLTQERINV